MTHSAPYATESLAIIGPAALLPAAEPQEVSTPYGTISARQTAALHWLAPAPPHALIYGAKLLGINYIIELLPLQAVNRLLAPGDLLLPDDLLDLTRQRRYTFFVGKGYGFLPQHPPYCPLLRAALRQAAGQGVASLPAAQQPRIFARGTYAAISSTAASLDEADWRALAGWGADAVGYAGVPASFLSRELELCYAPLGYVMAAAPEPCSRFWYQPPGSHDDSSALLRRIVQALAAGLPAERDCLCARAMQPVRARGIVGDDWRTWVATAGAGEAENDTTSS